MPPKRNTALGLATSLHLALFALIAKPVRVADATPTLVPGGLGALVPSASLFYEVSA